MNKSGLSRFISAFPALVVAAYWPVAVSEELLTYKQISATTTDNLGCQKNIKVRLDAESEDNYRSSRLDMQKLSKMVKTYLWLDCKELEGITYEGYVEGRTESVYQATAVSHDDWFLKEGASREKMSATPSSAVQKTEQAKIINTLPKAKVGAGTTVGKSTSYTDLATLEKAAKSSDAAKLDLAMGLLDLPGKPSGLDFPNDGDRGLSMLEELAAAGNKDAAHILGQAYSNNKAFKLNIPLLEKLTGQPFNPGQNPSEEAAAMLTLDAAAQGSELALDHLQEAGVKGSHHAYYAVGMMYLLDKQKTMPYEQDFLSNALNMQDAAGPGAGNVDVGLHFLTLAAETGNSDAGELLTDLGIRYKRPKKIRSAKASKNVLQKTHTSTQRNMTQRAARSSSSSGSTNMSNTSLSGAGLPSMGTGIPSVSSGSTGTPASATAASTSLSGSVGGSGLSATASSVRDGLIASGTLADILEARTHAANASTASTHQSGSAPAATVTRPASATSQGSRDAVTTASSGASASAMKDRQAGVGQAGNHSGAGRYSSNTTSANHNNQTQSGSHSAQNKAEIID